MLLLAENHPNDYWNVLLFKDETKKASRTWVYNRVLGEVNVAEQLLCLPVVCSSLLIFCFIPFLKVGQLDMSSHIV